MQILDKDSRQLHGFAQKTRVIGPSGVYFTAAICTAPCTPSVREPDKMAQSVADPVHASTRGEGHIARPLEMSAKWRNLRFSANAAADTPASVGYA